MADDKKQLREQIYAGLSNGLRPVGALLKKSGLNPNQVTWTGVTLNTVAAGFVVGGYLTTGGVIWFLAGLLDLLDGAMARGENLATPYGAFLDSTTDRISDGVMFAALVYHFAAQGEPLYASLAALTLLAAFLTSYARAKAESLGVSGKSGLVTRAERIFVVGVGLIFYELVPALFVLLILSSLTVAQRMIEAHEQLNKPSQGISD